MTKIAIYKNFGKQLYTQTRKGLGMNQYKGGLSEIEFTVTLFSNTGMILLPFLKILGISFYIKGRIAHFC